MNFHRIYISFPIKQNVLIFNVLTCFLFALLIFVSGIFKFSRILNLLLYT